MKWSPISKNDLYDLIIKSEKIMDYQSSNLWESIKITPQKWDEPQYGKEGNGFWVVGIIGKSIIWYNDIEDGFNQSQYSKYGKIDEYWCNQDELHESIFKLSHSIKTGEAIYGKFGPPE